jgi:hypothetical protein
MGDHADSCQVMLFQEINLVGQGRDVGEFERSELFTPNPLELREPVNKWGEVGFMVFTVEPCHVPSLKQSFHGKVKEASTKEGLKTHTSNNLSVNGTRLIF